MATMKVGDAIAHILKREGVEWMIGYPVNHILEHVAKVDVRPIIVRQERIGLHMADAISRVTSGKKIGVFAMQHGPGTENAYGGVAQAYSESDPDPGPADGLRAPHRLGRAQLQRLGLHALDHQVRRADHIGQGDPERSSAAPSSSCARAAAAPSWSRSRPTCGPRRSIPTTTSSPSAASAPAPTWTPSREAAKTLGRRQAAGHLCRPGRALGRSLDRAEGTGRAARDPRHHQPRRQERLPRNAPAVARLRRPRHSRRRCARSSTSRT